MPASRYPCLCAELNLLAKGGSILEHLVINCLNHPLPGIYQTIIWRVASIPALHNACWLQQWLCAELNLLGGGGSILEYLGRCRNFWEEIKEKDGTKRKKNKKMNKIRRTEKESKKKMHWSGNGENKERIGGKGKWWITEREGKRAQDSQLSTASGSCCNMIVCWWSLLSSSVSLLIFIHSWGKHCKISSGVILGFELPHYIVWVWIGYYREDWKLDPSILNCRLWNQKLKS